MAISRDQIEGSEEAFVFDLEEILEALCERCVVSEATAGSQLGPRLALHRTWTIEEPPPLRQIQGLFHHVRAKRERKLDGSW